MDMTRIWAAGVLLGVLTTGALAEDAIKFGASNANTGPIAVACTPAAQGLAATLSKVNDAGGVNGRKIDYETLDDAYSPQRAVGNIRRLVQQDNVLAVLGGCGTATAAAILPMLEKDEVPYLFPYAGLDALVEPPKKSVFSLLPRYATQLAAIVPYVIAKTHPTTASIFTFNIAGQETVRATLKDVLDKAGVKIVGDVLFDVTAPDRTTYALQAKDQNPDLVILNDSTPGAARFVLQLERQGWKPKALTGVSTLTDEAFLRAVGHAADGIVIAPGIVAPAAAPQSAECVADLAAFDKSVIPGHYSMFGCLAAKVTIEALRHIQGDVTRASLVQALDTMQNFDTGFSGKVSFADGQRMGLTSIYVFSVDDGQFKVGEVLPLKP